MTLEHACAVWIPTFIFFAGLAFLHWYGKLPSVSSISQLASVVDSKGGNILVLGSMSLIFFFTAMKLTYWCLQMSVDGKLSPDNAVMMLGLSFVTGSAFGGAFSSMLKAMSGQAIDPGVVKPVTPVVPPATIPTEEKSSTQPSA